MDQADLQNCLYLAALQEDGREMRLQDELAALEEFSGDPEIQRIASAQDALLQRAHLALLWAQMQEERLWEIAELENAVAAGLGNLAMHFDGRQAFADAIIMPDVSLAPWRVCIAAAAFFIPSILPVFVEGPMREELADALEFRPSPGWSERTGLPVLEAEAQISDLPGLKSCYALPHLLPRLWLVGAVS